jgi:hypothetical protein
LNKEGAEGVQRRAEVRHRSRLAEARVRYVCKVHGGGRGSVRCPEAGRLLRPYSLEAFTGVLVSPI